MKKLLTSIIALLIADGAFALTSAIGLKCYGTYNPWEQSTTKILSFRTSDGRYGTAILSQAGKNGIGIGQANEALGL